MRKIERTKNGMLFVNGLMWTKDMIADARRGSEICRESRRTTQFCDCLCCQVTKFIQEEPTS